MSKFFLMLSILYMIATKLSAADILKISPKLTPMSAPKTTKSVGFLESIFEDFCVIYMNSHFGPKKDWKCSLLNYDNGEHAEYYNERQVNKTNIFIQCTCSIKYSCYDHEEFVLDSDLVDSNNITQHKDFYNQQCVQGINELTSETDWKCFLQLDRLDTDGYYCRCKRIKLCQIDKILEI